MKNAKVILGDNISYAENSYGALENADALIILTEWNEFRTPDFNKIKSLLKKPVIFDGRNLYDPEKMKENNFIYYSVGRFAIK
jgi:UDPglucose 6-dehydrogenase